MRTYSVSVKYVSALDDHEMTAMWAGVTEDELNAIIIAARKMSRLKSINILADYKPQI